MKKSKILDELSRKILILDGATGTELQKRGMPSGVCPEVWALENPEVPRAIHRAYREAGADILYTCSFGGNPFKLAEYGRKDVEDINRNLARLARSSVDDRALIAGDMGPSGRFIDPFGDVPFDKAMEAFRDQARGLKEGEVDLFVIETQMDIQEARAALLGVREVWDGFIMVTMTFEGGGRTLNGTSPEAALITLQSLGADAVGINCSTGPEEMVDVIRRMKKLSRVPLIAKPNAGMPVYREGQTVFPMDAETFAPFIRDFAEAGANFFGGCCGTTPEHIRLVSRQAQGLEAKAPTEERPLLLSSAREALVVHADDSMRIIGEGINPSGEGELEAALKKGEFEDLLDMAREQADAGADLVDLKVGIPGIDEETVFLGVIRLLTPLFGLPLVIDSSDPSVIEAAVRLYPGRALINSVSGKKENWNTLLPLARRYGAALVLLPLEDGELPDRAARRIEIVEDLYGEAKKIGFNKEDILVDVPVTAISSQPKSVRETLGTIRRCKKEGFGTIAGISNVSSGLPSREWLDGAFLNLAQGAGLTFALANPENQTLMNLKRAGDILWGRNLN